MRADSTATIQRRYLQPQVVERRPAFLSQEMSAGICSRDSHDIDAPANGRLATLE